MLPFTRSRILGLAFALCLAGTAGMSASAAPPIGATSLDRFILAQMRWSHIPGLSAVVVKNGAIVWRGAYGFRDAAKKHPVTPDTLFELASVSKTVLAVAVLQLVEQGKLGLDGDVSGALPFRVRNPNFPDRTITLRMLLGHVSGIVDNWPVIKVHSVENADAPVSLRDWFSGYLTPEGAWYSKEANFSRNPPGTAFTYSNQAAALSALAVEGASGEPFDRYCRDHIFAPLDMTETSYRLAELDPAHIAMPQVWQGGRFVELGHHGFPDYPAGTLRTSAPQLAHFLLMVMNGGEYPRPDLARLRMPVRQRSEPTFSAQRRIGWTCAQKSRHDYSGTRNQHAIADVQCVAGACLECGPPLGVCALDLRHTHCSEGRRHEAACSIKLWLRGAGAAYRPVRGAARHRAA